MFTILELVNIPVIMVGLFIQVNAVKKRERDLLTLKYSLQ